MLFLRWVRYCQSCRLGPEGGSWIRVPNRRISYVQDSFLQRYLWLQNVPSVGVFLGGGLDLVFRVSWGVGFVSGPSRFAISYCLVWLVYCKLNGKTLKTFFVSFYNPYWCCHFCKFFINFCWWSFWCLTLLRTGWRSSAKMKSVKIDAFTGLLVNRRCCFCRCCYNWCCYCCCCCCCWFEWKIMRNKIVICIVFKTYDQNYRPRFAREPRMMADRPSRNFPVSIAN